MRDASGMVSDFVGIYTATNTTGCTSVPCQKGWVYTNSSADCTLAASGTNKCFAGGLLNDYQAMQKISGVAEIIIAGIFAATLSSALASLVSAPKIFQAVCKDKIFPIMNVFGVGAKKTDEPQRAYLLAFVISLGFILIGELNVIAPIISNFFLASYTLINYSCFSSSLSKSPGWRPAFKYYNMWLSLFGAFVCCGIMFVIQWWAALVTIVIVIVIYKYVDYKKPDINWGSSTQAIVYTQALNQTLKLNNVDDHVRNFRPQVLVLTGNPKHRPALVHLASSITKNTSLLICGDVLSDQHKYPFDGAKEQQDWLNKQKFKAFYSCVQAPSLDQGAHSLMQAAGLGKMKTNTLLMGFKTDWQNITGKQLTEYTNLIRGAFQMKFGVCILRMSGGLDLSEFLEQGNEVTLGSSKPQCVAESGDDNDAGDASGNVKVSFTKDQGQMRVNLNENKELTSVNVAKVKGSALLQYKPEKGKTIDVWWLTEDGGLTVLLPHMISTRQQWAGCKLRVFTIQHENSSQNEFSMGRLMSKFRIDCEDIIYVDGMKTPPSDAAVKSFYDKIEPYRYKAEETSDIVDDVNAGERPWKITEAELILKKKKILRYIRIQELLQKHSKNAAMIFMTLPLPKDTKSTALYMAWLDELTKDLPPITLIRGNQNSVLTFYS